MNYVCPCCEYSVRLLELETLEMDREYCKDRHCPICLHHYSMDRADKKKSSEHDCENCTNISECWG